MGATSDFSAPGEYSETGPMLHSHQQKIKTGDMVSIFPETPNGMQYLMVDRVLTLGEAKSSADMIDILRKCPPDAQVHLNLSTGKLDAWFKTIETEEEHMRRVRSAKDSKELRLKMELAELNSIIPSMEENLKCKLRSKEEIIEKLNNLIKGE